MTAMVRTAAEILAGIEASARARTSPSTLADPSPGPHCGTTRGHKQHAYRGEHPCRPCKDAISIYARQLRARRRAAGRDRVEAALAARSEH